LVAGELGKAKIDGKEGKNEKGERMKREEDGETGDYIPRSSRRPNPGSH
jgi:hypothetical protein